MLFLFAVIGSALWLALKPSSWSPVTRSVLVRQLYFTGVQALPITVIAGLAVGISVVGQLGIWLDKVDQLVFFGPLVMGIVIENLAPLLVNLMVVSRSGTAMTTELASMVVQEEIRVLDSQGIDPFLYLVIPRLIAMPLAILCLTVIFIAMALLGGYGFGLLLNIHTLRYRPFADTVFVNLDALVIGLLLAKTVIPGLLAGAICCVRGLSVAPIPTAVPQASASALPQAIAALFISSVLLSLVRLL
ncbi:MAG: ABC transporter permease [Candidatus Competibacteraceae bacterium]